MIRAGCSHNYTHLTAEDYYKLPDSGVRRCVTRFLGIQSTQIDGLFQKAEKEMIKNAGGKKRWNKLSESTRSVKWGEIMESILLDLGKKELEKLPESK